MGQVGGRFSTGRFQGRSSKRLRMSAPPSKSSRHSCSGGSGSHTHHHPAGAIGNRHPQPCDHVRCARASWPRVTRTITAGEAPSVAPHVGLHPTQPSANQTPPAPRRHRAARDLLRPFGPYLAPQSRAADCRSRQGRPKRKSRHIRIGEANGSGLRLGGSESQGAVVSEGRARVRAKSTSSPRRLPSGQGHG